jgi:hypothetical protein
MAPFGRVTNEIPVTPWFQQVRSIGARKKNQLERANLCYFVEVESAQVESSHFKEELCPQQLVGV